MTPEQILLVQSSFAEVLPIADTAATLFYSRLFELDPALRSIFRDDMHEQGKKLMAMLKMVVNGLTRLQALVPAIESMGRRHVAYGVRDEHYAVVGAALIWTLHQGLGKRFTPETEAAWRAAYTILASIMQNALKAAA